MAPEEKLSLSESGADKTPFTLRTGNPGFKGGTWSLFELSTVMEPLLGPCLLFANIMLH